MRARMLAVNKDHRSATPMLTTDELLNGMPPEATLRFIATFARFEFAMKQCGYLRRIEHGRVAEACREKHCADLPSDFFENVRAAQIATTLIEQPPRNLFVRNDTQPQFGNQATPVATTAQLLDAVCRVRNTLFHGNKMYPANRKRDAGLMDDALAVIDVIMQRMQNLFIGIPRSATIPWTRAARKSSSAICGDHQIGRPSCGSAWSPCSDESEIPNSRTGLEKGVSF
jgi:hypothetical protein